MRRNLSIAGLALPLALALLQVPGAWAQDSVSTVAGRPLRAGYLDGAPNNALFSDPAGIAIDASGNVYVADNAGHTVRKISNNGSVTTLAGQGGVAGSADGHGTAARFDSPTGLALDAEGNLFVSDTGNHTIRRITMTGAVSTVAGYPGQSGNDDGPAAAARFESPLGLVVSTEGTVYVADCGNHLIRVISTNGLVTTLAGHAGSWGMNDGAGSAARFNGPVGLALDGRGRLLVSDSNNHIIRQVDPEGNVTTFAGFPGKDGSVDGDLGTALFCNPAELVFDHLGNLFIASSFDHTIRRISPQGKVSTISGASGVDGAEDGSNREARFFNPYGVAVEPRGYLIVTDTYNQTIRRIFTPFEVTIRASASGYEVRVNWDSVIGRTYQVQVRSAVTDTQWQDQGGPITAAGLSTIYSVTVDSNPAGKFYRVVTAD